MCILNVNVCMVGQIGNGIGVSMIFSFTWNAKERDEGAFDMTVTMVMMNERQ